MLEVTIDRLSKAEDRTSKYIDQNLFNWVVSTALPIVKSKAVAKGLSVFAVEAIHVEKTGFMSVAIRWGLKTEEGKPLDKYLEEGTDAHDIEARFAKYLKFIGRDGNNVFRKIVKHPGTAAMNIFKDSKKMAQEIMKAEITKRVNQHLQATRVQ
jgi:hypothetical protein